jgi:MFS family permease
VAAAGAERTTIRAIFLEAPTAVKVVLIGLVVNGLSRFLAIFLILFLTSRGYSSGQAALAVGVWGAGSIAGALIGGAVVDRLGARNVILISMVATAVLTASLLVIPDYSLLLGAVALAGVAGQMFRPSSATMVSTLTSGDRQVMIFAMVRWGLNVGATGAPLIGYGLYNLGHQSYTLVFVGEALIALAFAALAWVALPANTAERRERVGGSKADRGVGYLAVLRDRRFTVYLIANFLHSAVYVQYLSTLPLDVNASGVPVLWYTLAVSLNGFIVIAFELWITKLSQRWPRRLTIALGWALIGVGVAMYGLPIGPLVIIAGTLVWSLGEIVGGPTVLAYPALAAPESAKGRYIGSFQFTFGLGQAVGPLVGGWLFIQFGHLVWPMIATGELMACLLSLFAVRSARETAAPATGLTTEVAPAELPAE